MADIYTGLIDGSSVQLNPQGYYISRKEIIDGVTGNSYQKEYNAMVLSGHHLGQQHPVYVNSFVQNLTATMLSTNQVQLDISYEPMVNLPVEIQISNRVASMETNKDAAGTDIEVSYTYPADYKHNEELQDVTETVGKTVEKQVPTTTITWKRREIISGEQLITLQKTYTGYVNSNTMFGDTARNWLLTGIDSTYAGFVYTGTYPNGTLYWVYDVSYIWEKPLGGWDAWVVFVDPNTGDPPPPATWTTNVTNKQIQIYGEIDFSLLLA